MSMVRKKKANNKGFTLVELIVVIVILAILAAILVPALLGYIDRAKNQKYIIQARELMNATQACIVEEYAKNKTGFENSVRRGPITGNNKNDKSTHYGYFSSNWAGAVLKGEKIENTDTTDAKGGVFKKAVCEKLAVYLEAKNYKNISLNAPYCNGNNITVDSYKGQCAFFIAYDGRGRIFYMQYTNEGKLVTFDGKAFKVEDGGSFINHRNPSN